MLEIKDLSKEFLYEGFKLDNLSFNLKPGYIMGFIGPNGSGKSTTIKLIMNLLKRDSGEIKIFGKDNLKYEKEIKDRIGFVYDENHFYETFTLDEMKNFIAPFYSKWDDKLFYKYLEEFELLAHHNVKSLSKGMKMKFSLAIALSHGADLIIMDEPTAGLDPIFRREILDVLYGIIQDERKSIFFSTHITSDLEQIADYITFIDKGRLVFSKPMDELMDTYKVIKGGPDLLNDFNRQEVLGLRETRVGFEALTDNIEKIRGLFGQDIIIERASLDDIMYYTRRA